MGSDKHIVLYDGFCNLCLGVVRFISRRDRKSLLSFVPLQSIYGQTLLHDFGVAEQGFDTVVYFKGEAYYLRSSAILHILKDLGGIWSLAYIFIIFPPLIRDFLYNIISRTRFRIFGRKSATHY